MYALLLDDSVSPEESRAAARKRVDEVLNRPLGEDDDVPGTEIDETDAWGPVLG